MPRACLHRRQSSTEIWSETRFLLSIVAYTEQRFCLCNGYASKKVSVFVRRRISEVTERRVHACRKRYPFSSRPYNVGVSTQMLIVRQRQRWPEGLLLSARSTATGAKYQLSSNDVAARRSAANAGLRAVSC